MWNTQEHMEAYLAVPSMGAVLHTLNIRLFPEQLAYVVNHGGDKVVIVDDSLVPLLGKIVAELTTVECFVVVGDGDASALGTDRPVLRYAALLEGGAAEYDWPEIDERQAAAMCYTSGTTGNPKGVAYSHRSAFLHSFAATTPNALNLSERDRILMIVPMFHAGAWGLPYAAFLSGAALVMPGKFLQAEPLTRMVKEERVTFAGAVPTIWGDIYRYGEEHEIDLSSIRSIICGGSAVPRSLMENFERKYGVRIIQAWGMTETSPLAAVAHPPGSVEIGCDEEMDWRARTGRVVGGIELRIVDDRGLPLPWDGEAVGEIEVRGPWVTGSYYRDPAPEKFDDGWLRTGDVGTVSPEGYIQITDRAKDVIKSGGEWISSVELENVLMGHPDVLEASVIGVPDPRWDERPLACVVRKPGCEADADALAAYLAEHVAKWQVPERWSFIDEVPKTSVGKFDKKVLRAQHEKGELRIEQLD
jgi:fatty-acyl-CoA synthase